MWYLKACRSCLTTTGILERMSALARRQFHATTGLLVEEDDGLPQYLCAECYTHIKKAFQFRKRSRRAYFVLKEILTVKKLVSQKDMEMVDRKKTNLTSQYTIWNTGTSASYIYTVPEESTEDIPKESVTPEIEAALKESLLQPNQQLTNKLSNTNGYLQDYKTESDTKKTIEQQKCMVKQELNNINNSVILVDIKPANWEEIEREEQIEIEAAMRETVDVETYDDNLADDVVPEDIDLEDVFKGLKEESEQESEIEEPELIEHSIETKAANDMLAKKKKKQIEEYIRTNYPLVYKPAVRDGLKQVKVRMLTKDYQRKIFEDRKNERTFKNALYKCGICLRIFESVKFLYNHVNYHNYKMKFKHMCEVCLDRFESQTELVWHAANLHWYEYQCGRCQGNHYSLSTLLDCLCAKNQSTIQKRKSKEKWDVKCFDIKLMSPAAMYAASQTWRGIKHDKGKSCEKCKIHFSTKSEYKTHMERHRISSKYPCICDLCSQRYKDKVYLSTHIKHWHLYSYRCKQCNKQFTSRYEAKKHYLKEHDVLRCGICNEEFGNRYWMTQHTARKHKMDCNLCDYTTTGNEYLLWHQLRTHGYIHLNTVAALNDPRFYCGECKVYFSSEQTLFRHHARENHPEVFNYENGCTGCMVLFRTKEDLLAHVGNCKALYPRKCHLCEEVLSDWVTNRQHQKKHEDQATTSGKQLCETCGKLFCRSALRNHKLTHLTLTQELACRFCSAKGQTATQHVSHILFNHTYNPYCCTICGQRFIYRSCARDHILKTHAPVRPYSCEACSRLFSHLDYLHEHCRKVHNVDLKKTDKSVYLSKRMFGKIYIYPHIKIDGSLIDMNVLENTPVEICDYMDENNRPVSISDAFFFDPTVDTSAPTRCATKKKTQKKKTREQQMVIYQRWKERKPHDRRQRLLKSKRDATKQNNNASFDENFAGNVTESMVEDETSMAVKQIEEESLQQAVFENEPLAEIDDSQSKENIEVETENIVGELVEKDGECFVKVDGVLYKIENDDIVFAS